MRIIPYSLRFILKSFIILGFLLATINFISFPSLWLDEASLALNIVSKSESELLLPLDYEQVAPIGFILIEKIFSYLGGNSDWSLRVFPLISFFISIFLMYSLSLKIIKEKIFVLFSTGFYCLSYFPIAYSSQVKQYMSDVLVCLIILLSTITFTEKPDRKQLLIYSLVGMISVWFSNISVILLFTAGLYILYKIHRGNKDYFGALMVLGSWVMSFVVYYFLFIHNHPTKAMMIEYWSATKGFLPVNILSGEFYWTILVKLFQILGYDLLSLVAMPVFAIGLFFLATTKKEFLFLLIFPVILHLSLSYFEMYPFEVRLILYLIPILVIAISSGLYFLFSVFKLQNHRLLPYLLIIPLILNLILLSIRGFPIKKEEIKEALTYLDERVVEGEKVYVYYGAQRAYTFYKREFSEITKMHPRNIIFGSKNRKNWADYEKDISKIQSPVWILFSHIYSVHNEMGLSESDFILELFRKNDFQIVEKQNYHGASIYKAIPINHIPNSNSIIL